jgi:hypothetical protein
MEKPKFSTLWPPRANTWPSAFEILGLLMNHLVGAGPNVVLDSGADASLDEAELWLDDLLCTGEIVATGIRRDPPGNGIIPPGYRIRHHIEIYDESTQRIYRSPGNRRTHSSGVWKGILLCPAGNFNPEHWTQPQDILTLSAQGPPSPALTTEVDITHRICRATDKECGPSQE